MTVPETRPEKRNGRSWIMIGLVIIGVPLAVVLLLLAAWGGDALITGRSVNRGVTVAGRDVGGLDRQDLKAVLAGMNIEYGERTVTITAPSGALETTAAELGIGLDVDATAASALEVGRIEPAMNRPGDWLRGVIGERAAPTTYLINRTQFRETVRPLVEANHEPPVERSIEPTATGWVPTTGSDGQILDTDTLLDEVVIALVADDADLEFEVTPVPATPRFTPADAETFAAEANALTEHVLTVTAAEGVAELVPDELRRWFTPVTDGEQLALDFDAESATEWIENAFAGLRLEPLDARFDIGFGVVIQPSEDGRVCCVEDSTEQVMTALESGDPQVDLQLEIVQPRLTTTQAEGLGIVEPVASFTTNHACCQPRVQNIQRMADLIRGAVIMPGETFSVNDYVGPRTAEKGFVSAGAIYAGVFVDDVGGGVSQFATTFFNAAFFAGLEYDIYQAHTIYISRYPYGREATISHPAPDLQIVNASPHGVLVWPTYNGSSITVTLWSTKWVDADQTAQSEAGVANGCTRVTTERTRRFLSIEEADRIRGFPIEIPEPVEGEPPPADPPDPAVVIDNVYAVYQPSEGVIC